MSNCFEPGECHTQESRCTYKSKEEGVLGQSKSFEHPGCKVFQSHSCPDQNQVTNWIKSHVDENPLVDLSPVFKDYGKHLEQLRLKLVSSTQSTHLN